MNKRVVGFKCVMAALALSGVVPLSMAAAPDAVNKSRQEQGLVIYGNVAADNWAPAVAAFNKKYPWISVKTLDLGPGDSFERYYAESSVGRASADLIAAASPGVWLRFIKKGEVEPYVASDEKSLPDWSHPFPGLYTLSTDPMVIVYNKLILPPDRRPKSMSQLVSLARKYPKDFSGRMTTYDAARHPFASAIHWSYVNQMGPAGWSTLRELGPLTRPEGGGASMAEKVATGEYTTIYFGSPLTFFKHVKEHKDNEILGWNLIEDGTPVIMRGIAITKNSRSKFSAQLFLDFMVSHEGQVAVSQGGLTPYREDIRKEEVPFLTYRMIREQIGEKNIVLVKYDEKMVADNKTFTDAWRAAYKQKGM
jgi:iron(III) transport system substrate-binding protein